MLHGIMSELIKKSSQEEDLSWRASPWKLPVFDWMMQERMNVDNYPIVSSSRFMLIVSFQDARFARDLGIIYSFT